MKKLLIVVLLLCSISSALAITDTAAMFLLISSSPQSNGMGETVGPVADTSPINVIMFPATAGRMARHHYIANEFYISDVDWLPSINADITFDAQVTCLGLNLGKYTKLPISLGLAIHQMKLDLGDMIITSEQGIIISKDPNWNKSNGVTGAIDIDLKVVTVSAGMTWKRIKTNYTDEYPGAIETNARDKGCLVQAPLINICKQFGCTFQNIEPFLTPGYIYSSNNIGDEMPYYERGVVKQLPRSVSTGINVHTGIILHRQKGLFNQISLKWAREATDVLEATRTMNGNFHYQSGLGDIDFNKHILQSKAGNKIITKTGFELGLGNMLFLRKGRFEDIDGNIWLQTWGGGVNISRILLSFSEKLHLQTGLVDLLRYTSIQCHYARYHAQRVYSQYPHPEYHDHSLEDTTFLGFTINLIN